MAAILQPGFLKSRGLDDFEFNYPQQKAQSPALYLWSRDGKHQLCRSHPGRQGSSPWEKDAILVT